MRAALRHQLQVQGERPVLRTGDLSVDLVRRIEGKTVYGLTTPLLTDASGKKYGKSEKGAVFLAEADPETGFKLFGPVAAPTGTPVLRNWRYATIAFIQKYLLE